MGWTPQAQLTKSATRASANSTENTVASLASLPCAMSKLFERTVSSPHDLMAGATGLEPAASCVTGRGYNQLNYAPAWNKFIHLIILEPLSDDWNLRPMQVLHNCTSVEHCERQSKKQAI